LLFVLSKKSLLETGEEKKKKEENLNLIPNKGEGKTNNNETGNDREKSVETGASAKECK
jgi:hypothetical protein